KPAPAHAPTAAKTSTQEKQAPPVLAQSAQKGSTSSERKGAAIEESGDGRLIKASPLARRMAEEHSIDMHQIQDSGHGGRIVREDIEDFLEQGRAAPAAQPQPTAPPQEAPAGVS